MPDELDTKVNPETDFTYKCALGKHETCSGIVVDVDLVIAETDMAGNASAYAIVETKDSDRLPRLKICKCSCHARA